MLVIVGDKAVKVKQGLRNLRDFALKFLKKCFFLSIVGNIIIHDDLVRLGLGYNR